MIFNHKKAKIEEKRKHSCQKLQFEYYLQGLTTLRAAIKFEVNSHFFPQRKLFGITNEIRSLRLRIMPPIINVLLTTFTEIRVTFLLNVNHGIQQFKREEYVYR